MFASSLPFSGGAGRQERDDHVDVGAVAERVQRELERLAPQQQVALLRRGAAGDRPVGAEPVERVHHALAVEQLDVAADRRRAHRDVERAAVELERLGVDGDELVRVAEPVLRARRARRSAWPPRRRRRPTASRPTSRAARRRSIRRSPRARRRCRSRPARRRSARRGRSRSADGRATGRGRRAPRARDRARARPRRPARCRPTRARVAASRTSRARGAPRARAAGSDRRP